MPTAAATKGAPMSDTATLPAVEGETQSSIEAPHGRLAALRAAHAVWVWAGVVLCAAGFALLVYTWGRVAGLLNVALQLPYIVSGGFTAIGLILVGLTLVNIATKQQDAAERSRQLSELRELLSEMRQVMENDS
jgi:hypothetical protein